MIYNGLMNYSICTCKTKKGAFAVQVIYFHKRKTIIAKHVGSSCDTSCIEALYNQAKNWIQNQKDMYGLFNQADDERLLEQFEYLGFQYFYAYEFITRIFEKFNFHKHTHTYFKDLVFARIIEPQSKRSSVAFLQEFLGIHHSIDHIYHSLNKYQEKTKINLEKEVIRIAKQEFKFDFSFVLYDVTTLYFESFKDDEFKRAGFSKDNKSNQPQVVVGLMVTPEGFPLSYEVFKGNVFEGNTFLPILKAFKETHGAKEITVIADSAMFSKINLESLEQHNLNYIIGARLGSLKKEIQDNIHKQMKCEDHYSIRIGDLIVDYSSKRYIKDKKDLDKQIEKAKRYVNSESLQNPRIKYLKTENLKNTLNQDLIDKNTKLCGLKGYVTNLNRPNSEIIDYYHNLHRVEHAWRIAKSDLEARPIFHHKEESIRNHILICYLALTISIYLELKNKQSIQEIVHLLKQVTDAKIMNKKTGRVFLTRTSKTSSVVDMEILSY